MGFQTAVSLAQGAGVVGELYNSGPVRALPYSIVSADAAYNVFGRCFTVTSEGIAAAGNTTGSRIFAGFLVNPKGSASFGSSSGTLAPTLTLPNNSPAELLTMGSIWVSLPAAAAIGDLVVYDNTTGALSTIVPGAALPVDKSFAFAEVSVLTPTGSGLAVVTVSPTLVIPQLA